MVEKEWQMRNVSKTDDIENEEQKMNQLFNVWHAILASPVDEV